MEVLISRDRQWAIDAARMHLERFAPRAVGAKAVYLESPPSNIAGRCCVDSIQELDYIPWPMTGDQLLIGGGVFGRKNDESKNDESNATIVCPRALGANFSFVVERECGIEPCQVVQVYRDEDGNASCLHMAGGFRKLSNIQTTICSAEGQRYFNELLGTREYVVSVDPWVFLINVRNGGRAKPACSFGIGATADLLTILAPLLTPCGYFIRKKSKRAKGKPSRKKNDNARTLHMQIGYDRMKNLFPSQNDREVPLTFRRGHMRHLWKLSGINKLELPNDATARLRVALEKRVRRIYISPTWYGSTHAEDVDNEYDFDGEDMELSHGGSNN